MRTRWRSSATCRSTSPTSCRPNLGLRYTDEHKDYTFSRRTYSGALHPALGAIDGVTSNYDGDKFDYRVNLQYDWTDTLMTYVQWATGFKGGGISPRPFSPARPCRSTRRSWNPTSWA